MKIVLGSLQQESNTLTSRFSTRGDFDVHVGSRMLDHVAASGYLAARGAQLVPTLYANAVPGGRLREPDFLGLAGELVSMIPAGGVDGIWLYLHGALEVERVGSGELALLRMVREKVGFRVPVALALDFHANNTHELMGLVNVVVGYRTAPHRDMQETEIKAADLLVRCIERGLLPKPRMCRAPVVVPGDCVLTDEPPLREIMAGAAALERQPGMMVCNVFNGQAWVDAPHMGPSMVCVHERDEGAAKEAALTLAKRFFDARRDFRFTVEALEPEEALERASAEQPRPVFVSDSGDNTTAGSSGDSAGLLRLAQDRHLQEVLIGGLTDEPAVRACSAAGIGDLLDLEVGGTLEPTSTRASLRGRLLFKGEIEGWYGESAGPCAVVRSEGIDVILTARRCALTRPGIFEGLGLRLEAYRFVVVKLGYLYPELAKVAKRQILAFTTGGSTERLADMGMKHIRRPVFPLDDDFKPDFE